MKTITKYLGCGKIYKHKKAIYLSIYKFDDLNLKVLPIFERYPIQGVKSLDYLDFVKVLELIKNKEHLTKEGIEKIRKIKTGMNQSRLPK